MKKMIKIDNKEYFLQSSAYTQFAYKNETGRSFLHDLQEILKITQSKKTDNYSVEDLDNVTELILKISYVMIQEADEKQVTDYKSFVKGIETLYDNTEWIDEVITLACTPISGQLQKVK